jgi:hypothetical protein
MTNAACTALSAEPVEAFAANTGEQAVAEALGLGFTEPAMPALPAPLPPPLPRERPQNFVARHWRGEFSLARSFWVNHMVLGFGVGLAVAGLAHTINQRAVDQPVRWLISLTLTWSVIILFSSWTMVGVWRAATAYRREGKRYWGAAAKATIVIGLLNLAYSLGFVAIPQASGFYEIVAGDTSLGPHQFKVLSNGTMLDFSGGISFGTAKEFDTLLNAMDNVRTVRLNSNGGRIAEAQKISDLIHARGLSTYVTQQCVSACTIVFLGGKQRYLLTTAKLGFHQSYFRGMTASDRRIADGREEERLEHFGLSHAFAEHANAASPSSMWFPEQSELLREHVVTNIVTPQPPKPAGTAAPAQAAPAPTASTAPAPAAPAASAVPARPAAQTPS